MFQREKIDCGLNVSVEHSEIDPELGRGATRRLDFKGQSGLLSGIPDAGGGE